MPLDMPPDDYDWFGSKTDTKAAWSDFNGSSETLWIRMLWHERDQTWETSEAALDELQTVRAHLNKLAQKLEQFG